MLTSTYILDILVILAIWFATLFVMNLFYRYKRERMSELHHAEVDYESALDYYHDHPDDVKAKDRCYYYGEKYYKFEIPDYFNYPMSEYNGIYIEPVDNTKLRHDCVTKDLGEDEYRSTCHYHPWSI